ncbi:SIR2 family protein [Muricoccus aerilatus]|uniref:SIR2 family protein n=1 Tax=Muricoccus aerilatus TaxID=452982 RepID=UPI000694AF6B|nr:SIR2 family protein [Roseomonas aerilata]
MDMLVSSLSRGRKGHPILFCGAGLTADCLSFEDDATIGVTAHLLKLLNEELHVQGRASGYREIKNAAQRFRSDFGAHRLMNLLKERFHLKNVSASIVDIMRYPWSRIYTTNYDSGIEIALRTAGRRYTPLNNLDAPNADVTGTPVIHLHGHAEKWTGATFEDSCVLDSRSYHRLSGVKNWLEQLRYDIERASVVVFVGFSAADFHLSRVFFDTSGLRSKAFFINRPTITPDVDEHATQEEFGQPLYIGRDEFAACAVRAAEDRASAELALMSFQRYEAVLPSTAIPSTQHIEELFIWGTVVDAHLRRDQSLSTSDYHVLRGETPVVTERLSKPGAVVLVHGDICDGKTLVVTDAINGLFASRPIFRLHNSYMDLLDETSAILSVYPNAVFVAENCFALHENRLLGVARQVTASGGGLILTARNISAEGDATKLKALRDIPAFSEVRVGALQVSEVDALIILLDQIAGWREFRAFSPMQRRDFVMTQCNGLIPSVLLHLLRSSYVQARYKEEYNKVVYKDDHERNVVLGSLLLANIGLSVPVFLLSDILEVDFAATLERISARSGALRLVTVNGGLVQAVPSIGARNLLGHVVAPRHVVDATVLILEKLADLPNRSDLQSHIFRQLMRYSILQTVVFDEQEIDRFFDHISKIDQFRRMPLFWLQWHMAMAAQKRWSKAEDYLRMGHTAADNFDQRSEQKYNRKQLEDRRSKFLIERATQEQRPGSDVFRDTREALDVVRRLLGEREISHHPYLTIEMVFTLLERKGTLLESVQLDALLKLFLQICEYARQRSGVVVDGMQRARALDCLTRLEKAGVRFGT